MKTVRRRYSNLHVPITSSWEDNYETQFIAPYPKWPPYMLTDLLCILTDKCNKDNYCNYYYTVYVCLCVCTYIMLIKIWMNFQFINAHRALKRIKRSALWNANSREDRCDLFSRSFATGCRQTKWKFLWYENLCFHDCLWQQPFISHCLSFGLLIYRCINYTIHKTVSRISIKCSVVSMR